MRSISLELMRHGTDHNQLLSPLLPYLAVCENSPVTSWQQPFEHEELMARVAALSYPDAGSGSELNTFVESQRRYQLTDIGRALGRTLLALPGLTSSIGVAINALNQKDHRARNFLNLRLILSAKELALLPFETLVAPAGFPGVGQHLMLQLAMPFCITREARRSARTFYQAPEEPKILFAYCNVPNSSVPYRAHLLALRRALDPWMLKNDRLQDYVDVLPDATLTQLTQACRNKRYTHVHILAHGMLQDNDKLSNFTAIGLRAEGGQGDGIERVSAQNLARAIAPPDLPEEALNQPQVVTLATCNSGQGQMVPLSTKGESLAHALHEAGVPLVVASQFPLTFAGSVVMTEVLYGQLLRAHDPRHAMIETRLELAKRVPSSHDWASLVCYLSLPTDFDVRNQRAQLFSLRGRIVRGKLYDSDLTEYGSEKEFHMAIAEIDKFVTGVEFSIENQAHLDALRGGVWRRLAGWLQAKKDKPIANELGDAADELQEQQSRPIRIKQALTQSCSYYLAAYSKYPQNFWTLTMALRIQRVLRYLDASKSKHAQGKMVSKLISYKPSLSSLLPLSDERCWNMLYDLVCFELAADKVLSASFYSDAIEVMLMAPEFQKDDSTANAQCLDCVSKLIKISSAGTGRTIKALRYQLERFKPGGALYLPACRKISSQALDLFDFLAPEQKHFSRNEDQNADDNDTEQESDSTNFE